ncbi:PD-(D/E)XK nuclease family protein [Runella zeae]|uniref:PD-(D/E)XK nuclease family protein n=1 Tax=Runella zeae TaxID=94255 RepID=UPI00040C8951|nr:PD-(D/E)XK nuclease family protein [Runella zeae]
MQLSELIKDLEQWVFADQTVLLVQPKLVRRYDGGSGDRYYYTIDESGVKFYPSTTTFTKKVLPTSPYLVAWWKKHGEYADVLTQQAADYGTLMHIAFADFFLTGFDYATSREKVKSYVEALGHPKDLIGEWHHKLNKAVASHAKWCSDFKVEPVAIEMQLCSDELGIAGTLDLVHYMTDHKGRRTLCQTDYKSGNIYNSHALQLSVNKLIFEENFPHLEIEELYNWSPKDYRTAPTWEFVNQTKNPYTPEIIECFLKIYRAEYPENFAEKKIHVFEGTVKPNSTLTDNTKQITVTEYLIQTLQS